MKRISFATFVVACCGEVMEGLTTKDTKSTKGNKNEAHFLCVPW